MINHTRQTTDETVFILFH